jgi:uncharacterized protein
MPAVVAGADEGGTSMRQQELHSNGPSPSDLSTNRISRVGEYSGYSLPAYDSWVRESRYIEARDGTRLAVDVYRPTKDGVLEDKPLPVCWTAKRYLRATVDEHGELTGTLIGGTPIDRPAAWKLLSHGYVLAAADMRGTGASFGTWSECSASSSSLDGYDVNEWLAAQPWCSGVTGMFGVSYEGRMQLNTASAAPPSLKAIVPEVSPFDWYSIIHEGGIYGNLFRGIETHFRACDTDPAVAPVDGDDGSLVAAAQRGHEAGNDYSAVAGRWPFRDTVAATGEQPWLDRDGVHLVRGIERSGVATYHSSGWFARVGIDQLLWFANLARTATGDRHRILMGPWPQGGVAGSPDAGDRELWAVETLRFMDYWLKGIDNGIMEEPPVVFATPHSTKDRKVERWQFARTWPVLSANATAFFLAAGPSERVLSVNDGALIEPAPGDNGSDCYPVDYGVTHPRGDTLMGADVGADFTSYLRRCLTYTTSSLLGDIEVTGHPVVTLFVSSTAADADFIIHLLDVDERGTSTFVTHKRARASHRAVAEPPFFYFDIPWHSDTEADLMPIPAGEIVELTVDLLPVSYRFRGGHRIRISIACADAELYETPVLDPAPQVTVHTGAEYPSQVILPIVAGVDE